MVRRGSVRDWLWLLLQFVIFFSIFFFMTSSFGPFKNESFKIVLHYITVYEIHAHTHTQSYIENKNIAQQTYTFPYCYYEVDFNVRNWTEHNKIYTQTTETFKTYLRFGNFFLITCLHICRLIDSSFARLLRFVSLHFYFSFFLFPNRLKNMHCRINENHSVFVCLTESRALEFIYTIWSHFDWARICNLQELICNQQQQRRKKNNK